MFLQGVLRLYLIIFFKIICVTCAKKSSVAFVIDDTRSMWDDIDQVKKAAEDIMNIVTTEKANEIEDVVLVTFNDPEVVLREKTLKKTEFLAALNKIVVHNHNNFDCPEYALAGIERTLQESRPGSYLFVFTDASAKDHHRVNEIKNLCEKKQSQVIFVLTGDCNVPYSTGYKVYHDIAKACSGQVFRVSKNEVKYVLDGIKVLIKDQNTVVTSVVVPPSFLYSSIPFTVDEKTEYVVISTSGKNVKLFIKNRPNGKEMHTEKIFWQPSGKMVKFYAPSPGTYYANVRGETDVSIVVYARTDFKFDHGFSEFVPNSLADTSKLPIGGRKHHLSISVTDPEHTVNIKRAEILDMDGKIQATLPLRKANGDFYITDSFVSPASMFKIQVSGKVIKTGKKIKRISKTAIEPQIPPKPVSKAPEVIISEGSKADVDYDGDITLTCTVFAYPAPDIIWTSADGTVLNRESYVVEPPYKHISYLKLSKVKNPGTYYCRAKNEIGTKFPAIFVNTRSPFRVTTPLEGTTPTRYGEEKKIECDITSSYPMDIKWNIPLKPSEYSLSADKKVLTIKSVSIEAQAKYTCEATLISDPKQKLAVQTNVVISDLAPPTISPATPAVITVSHGEKIHIWCKLAGGVPPPSISWQVMRNDEDVFRDMSASGEQLIVDNASLADAGQYRCIAKNTGGQTDKITRVIVQKAPMVFIKEGSVKSVAYGSNIELTCDIVAYPLPKISWMDSNGIIVHSQNTIKKNSITSVIKLQNIKVSGTYSCFAENNLGKTKSKISLMVLPPLVAQKHPDDTTHSKYGAKTDITCQIKSAFPLKYKWFYMNAASVKTEIQASDKYTISPTGTTLHILHTNLDMVGKYTCEVSLLNDDNQKIAYTTDVKINNLSPPLLQETKSKEITVRDKDLVKIPCKIVGGIPPPIVTWQIMKKGDSTFKDLFASGQELTIDSATLADAGQYRCIARNAEGQADNTIKLLVEKAPETFIDNGKSVTVPYGSTNELKCQIEAFPLPKIVWKDSKGHELHSKNTVIIDKVTSILEVKSIKASDTYSCYAENYLGKNVASVQVLVTPPIAILTHNPETTSVNYKAPADIICDAKSSFAMTIKWFYQKNDASDKSEIHTSNKYMISPDARRLRILSTDLDLVGKYTCEASLISDVNEKTSATTKVEINNLKAPEITTSDKTITIMNGHRMSSSCKVNGIPMPVITWEFKYKNSNIFASIPTQGEKITIPNIGYEWAGSYKCTAKNIAGTQSSTIDVDVHGKPNITNIESEYSGVTGDKVLKIPCNVSGVPEPTITWKQGDKVVTSDAKISVVKNALFIKNPTEKDTQNFTCEAVNKYGYSMKNFQATISDFIEYDENQNNYYYLKPTESADIKCLLPHSDPKSVRWYVNNEKTQVVGTFYSLKNANFSNDGNYTCRVNTDEGSKSLNYVVDVGYEPDFIMQPSPTIAWDGDKYNTLDCSVRAKPSSTVKWYYNGKELDTKDTEVYITRWGAYTCKVSNVHGSVKHTFNVTTDGCLIDRTVDKIQNTPLLIDHEPSTWPQFSSQFNEFLTITPNQIINLECSTQDLPDNTFKTHPNAKQLKAECYSEDKFIVEGKIYNFSDLQCKESVKPSQVFTKKPCSTNGEIIEIGFKLDNGFLKVYEVCFSKTDQRILYTKVVMIDVNFGNIVGPSIMINQNNKTGKHDDELVKCQYNQRWLVSPVDVAFGPAQAATLSDKYNSVPVYEPCQGSSRMLWSDIETEVQNAMFTMDRLIVWTGASHYYNRGIPRYLWKVVTSEDGTFESIVHVNSVLPSKNDILCPKITRNKILRDIRMDVKDPYTYSCSMEDFSKAFKVPLSEFGLLADP